jgi:hypothetical protein
MVNMDLEIIWNKFFSLLEQQHNLKSISKKTYSGVPFLYIKTTHPTSQQQQLNDLLVHTAATAMKGKRLSCDLSFVRMKSDTFVYRVQFMVPQEKQFCCGNGCTDCVRLQK